MQYQFNERWPSGRLKQKAKSILLIARGGNTKHTLWICLVYYLSMLFVMLGSVLLLLLLLLIGPSFQLRDACTCAELNSEAGSIELWPTHIIM